MERVDCNTVVTVMEQVVTLAGPGTLFQAFHLVCNTSSSNRGVTFWSPEVVLSGTSSHICLLWTVHLNPTDAVWTLIWTNASSQFIVQTSCAEARGSVQQCGNLQHCSEILSLCLAVPGIALHWYCCVSQGV